MANRRAKKGIKSFKTAFLHCVIFDFLRFVLNFSSENSSINILVGIKWEKLLITKSTT